MKIRPPAFWPAFWPAVAPMVAALAALFATASAAPAAPALKTAVFAGGCFWSVEKFFEARPGVVRAVSGYSGGTTPRPTYARHPGHVEAVQVTYDPARVSYAQLVDYFFHQIDPTDARGQICDFGPSYQTAVFVASPQERKVAEQVRGQVAAELKAPVATRIRDASAFWPAEAYHQDFAKKNPAGYADYAARCGRERALKAVWGGRS